jgi:hypothetical protein
VDSILYQKKRTRFGVGFENPWRWSKLTRATDVVFLGVVPRRRFGHIVIISL